VSGQCVLVWNGTTMVGSATANPNGVYSVSVPAGTYTVEFPGIGPGSANCNSLGYLTQWYNDKQNQQSATPVPVAAGAATPNINAAMVKGGSISGTVTLAGGGPLQGICVNVGTQAAPPPAGANDLAFGFTDSQGHYQTNTALPTGTYLVHFEDCSNVPPKYAGQYFSGVADPNSATPVTVTAGQPPTPNINAQMSLAGSISGKVTDAQTGQGPGSTVCIIDRVHQNQTPASSTAASDGTYTITGAGPGTHNVDFVDCGTHKYAEQFYNDKPSIQTADPVSVQSSATTPNINAALASTSGGPISGTVTDKATGHPLQGISVALLANGSAAQTTSTAADGTYSFNVSNGTFKVQFTDPAGVYITQFFNDKPDQQSADSVTAPMSGVNAALVKGGIISGTVTDKATGHPLPGISVALLANGSAAQTTSTAADGTYSFNTSNGTFKVQFTDPAGVYITQFFNDKPDPQSADSVTPPMSGVNAALARVVVAATAAQAAASPAATPVTATPTFAG